MTAGVAAELQRDPLLAGLALQLPTHGRAAGEGQQLDAVIADQQCRILVGERHHRERAFRPSRFLHDLGQQQRRNRSLRRRLQNQRAAGGNRGRDLVGHQVQREVKRRDGEHRPERKAPHQAPASGSGLQGVERDVLAVNARALLGGDLEGVDGALHLDARSPDGLARFLADGAGEFLAPRRDVHR